MNYDDLNLKCVFRRLVTVQLCMLATYAGAVRTTETYTRGKPWTGGLGVTERTDRIREREHRGRQLGREYRIHKHGTVEYVEYIEPITNSTPVTVQAVDAAGATAQTVDTTFLGATLADTLAYPPDSMGAVGPSQFIVAVNGRVRSFNKSTGAADGLINADTDAFFASVMSPTAVNFTSDPRIRYDRLSQRWFIIIIDVPNGTGSTPNRILIAVSDGAVITGSSVWTFYQFQHDLVSPAGDTGKFADYPSLGIDANALYIGVNIFSSRGQGSFDNTTAYVVRKSSLLSGGPIVVTAFRDLVENNPNNSGPFTPQGVDNYDPGASEGYLIGVDAKYYGKLKLRRISDPGGTPAISGNITIALPVINGTTIKVPHLGNTGGSAGNLDGLDYRLLAAHYRNGSLWTTANLAVDNTGSSTGTDTRMGVQWYEIGGIPTGQTPAVLQSGTLFDTSAGNTSTNSCYWMGTAMVSGQGHVAMGFSAAGAHDYVNAGTAGRLKNDAPGTMRSPVLYTSTSSAYNPRDTGGNPINRWGDYSYTCLDPDDDMTMWTIQEWCSSPDVYGVQVARLLAPPPATPASCDPALLDPGANNINVAVTGTSNGDTGFFDPGPGFSNRIAASISGSGVTVNGITYNNPTNLILNLTVSSNAIAGTRMVTIINPDGQDVSSNVGILTINSIIVANHPPELPAISNQTIAEVSLLIFTNTATDADSNALTYSLGEGAPAGAGVTNNGVFSWMPDESQGPGTNIISMIATDDGVPSLSATQIFSVVVSEINTAPLLQAIADKVVTEGYLLTFNNAATDTDLPANSLSYALLAAPSGAGVDSNGVFSWTPDESQGPGTNMISMIATDDGTPSLSATQTFSVVVLETNAAPVLPAIADRFIHATYALAIPNLASDSDIPANTLTYSLDPGAPAAASVNPASGLFMWTPGEADAGTTNSIAVRVTDNGTPPLSDTQPFSVIVEDRPFIESIVISNHFPQVYWSSIAGQAYRLQYKPMLGTSAWMNVAGEVTAVSSLATKTDQEEAISNRFYRIQVVP